MTHCDDPLYLAPGGSERAKCSPHSSNPFVAAGMVARYFQLVCPRKRGSDAAGVRKNLARLVVCTHRGVIILLDGRGTPTVFVGKRCAFCGDRISERKGAFFVLSPSFSSSSSFFVCFSRLSRWELPLSRQASFFLYFFSTAGKHPYTSLKWFVSKR